ncbi:unnamed protein product, partial [Nesidiocoris tenuis]
MLLRFVQDLPLWCWECDCPEPGALINRKATPGRVDPCSSHDTVPHRCIRYHRISRRSSPEQGT